MAPSPSPSFEQILASREVLVVCGPGGVGKTTVAASSAVLAAQHLRGRVLVLTVDPARRLATALGLAGLGNAEVQVDPGLLTVDGVAPRGELWASQLDTKQAWDGLIRRHAPDAATRDAILANSLYENVTATFAQGHDYIAMERLHELHSSGRYDLIVVDTPPSRNAIDFLAAPERMAEFFGSRLLRWLTVPYRSKFFNAASRPFYSVADRILGQQFLRDIADFFLLFQTMYKGFVERAEEVQRTLASRRTSFVVVTTLEPAAVQECTYFVEELATRELQLGAIVANRVLPEYLRSREASATARRLGDSPEAVAAAVPELGEPALVAGVLREVGARFGDYGVWAVRQEELRVELAAVAPLLVSLPEVMGPVVDVAGLTAVAAELGR